MKRRILQGILLVLGLILLGRFALPGLILGGHFVGSGKGATWGADMAAMNEGQISNK